MLIYTLQSRHPLLSLNELKALGKGFYNNRWKKENERPH